MMLRAIACPSVYGEVVLIIGFLAVLSACKENETKPVELNGADFSGPQMPYDDIKLVPARTNWGPGLVFKGNVRGESIIVEDIVCENLFPTVEPKQDDIALTIVDREKNYTFKVELSPLEKIIKSKSLKIDLPSLARNTKYRLDPGRAFYHYYTIADQWKDGEPVLVDRDCQRSIDILKEAGEFTDQVWIVTGSTAFESPVYTFSDTTNLSAKVNADFELLLAAAAEAGYTSTTQEGITRITDGKFLYIKSGPPRLVRQWVRSTAVGATQRATLSTEVMGTEIDSIVETFE